MECEAIMVHVLYVALLECLKKRSSDALEIQTVVFWVVGAQRLRYSSTLNMEVTRSSET